MIFNKQRARSWLPRQSRPPKVLCFEKFEIPTHSLMSKNNFSIKKIYTAHNGYQNRISGTVKLPNFYTQILHVALPPLSSPCNIIFGARKWISIVLCCCTTQTHTHTHTGQTTGRIVPRLKWYVRIKMSFSMLITNSRKKHFQEG